jgi:hypothetical protein
MGYVMAPPPRVDYFTTPRAVVLAALAQKDVGYTPPHAVHHVRQQEEALEVPPASVYVSTAITSGGYIRDKKLDIRAVIEANNQTSGLLVGELVNAGGAVTATNVMVPTEIGKVRWPDGHSWRDTDYMTFYFAYASGLSGEAAEKLMAGLAVAEYEAILRTANDRENLNNEERWPSYRAFTQIALGMVAGLLRSPKAQSYPAFESMLQLVDVDLSLGCQSERLYANFFGLDLIVPAVNEPSLPENHPLRLELTELRNLGARVGVAASPVMPVAVTLNPRPSLI